MKVYLILLYEFFKTGLFSVGGGLATLPFLYEMAGKYSWFSTDTLADMLAVSESTPGPIGINMATYAGIKAAGIGGGIVATLALICPSIIVICIIAKMLDKFKDSKMVNAVMGIIRPAATGLIAAAGIRLFEIAVGGSEKYLETGLWYDWLDIKSFVFLCIITFAVIKWKKHPALYIAVMAVVGIVFKL
ncbi:MAG: chromate transporter [Eubacterium sp.]|nr:chromate transporter [Eubacterium sp.]